MTTPETTPPSQSTPWYKSKKMWIAVPLTLVLIGANLVIHKPAAGIAGMMTDSCSSNVNVELLWQIWLGYLWKFVMLICSLIPAYLILTNKSWGKVVLGVLAGGAVVVAWYILWAPVLWIAGC